MQTSTTRNTIFTISVFLLALSLLPLAGSASVHAQTPTATPDPTIVALEARVNDLSTQVAHFEMQVNLNRQTVELEALDRILYILVGAGVLTAVGVWFGIRSPRELAEKARAMTEEQLKKAIYRADPTYLPINIPAVGFEKEAERLRRLSFAGLRPYTTLSEIQPGSITIYYIPKLDEDRQANNQKQLEELRRLERFLKEEKIQPGQNAFIVYTPGRIEGGEFIYDSFDNLTFANNTITIATHIYALARGLIQ